MKLPEYFYFRVKPNKDGTWITLEDASDADVVEVVRCKDCAHWEEYNGKNGEPNCGWCDEILDRTTYCLYFCADGVRRRDKDASSEG